MNLQTLTTFIGGILAAAITALASRGRIYGTGANGPTTQVIATVRKTWVDSGWFASHYMVATADGAVFEVDNSFTLGVTNADTIFGLLEAGKVYTLTVTGNAAVGPFMKSYPFIVNAAASDAPQANVASE